MRKYITILAFVLTSLISVSQENMDYFLPADISYKKEIPTPEDFFGQQIGEWHLNYEQVLSYMKEITLLSERVIIREYARSWENRPLVHLIFTSESNQNKLEELKDIHVQYATQDGNMDNTGVPLVINLGYGVHGNESSATNSSVLTAYYLAAAEGNKIDKLLENTIILLDPCLNPDGLTRHSTWANMHQSETVSSDSNSRQFEEVWPGGRGNHYWFDLNRDYLLLVHPESEGRISKFHEWLPNIVTDHHEMGSNSTFFFQPGVPSRNNPLTPENNYVLTHKIADYHARYLDKIGSPYFSEEQFDDYYFGKGSSYPDVNGGVGILFEQAGYRGRIRETENGIRKLSYGIRNQFTVTLSTLDAAIDLKDELLDHQQKFYNEAIQLANNDPVKAYIFGNENELQTSGHLVKLLQKHQIEVFANNTEITKNEKTFNPGSSFVVPLKQKQYRLIKSIFEQVDIFSDSTFYDVSTWNFPYTFNVPFEEIGSLKELDYDGTEEINSSEGKIYGEKSGVAYLFQWNEYSAPQALYKLQKAGLQTKVATQQFSFVVDGELKEFSYGTILINAKNQSLNETQIFQLIEKISKETGINFYSLSTGLSPQGIDLGSNSFIPVQKPEILIFIDGNTRSTNAGELWHLFDQRYQIPTTLVETGKLGTVDLSKYNTIILPTGSYREWGDFAVKELKSWIQKGGVLIANQGASEWAAKNNIGSVTFKQTNDTDTSLNYNYANRDKERNINRISGAIFQTAIDNSHPICYGYSNGFVPVFKSGNSVANSLKIKYAEPVKFAKEPFLSGFISDKNLDSLKDAPVVSVQNFGRGKIISYYENMTFRGIWLGTNKLIANGVFFGNIIW